MDESLSQQFRKDPWPIVGFATAEHGMLQAARAATTAEVNGRITAYLATLSGVLVAFGFVLQAGGFDRDALLFGAATFAGAFVVGLLTIMRATQASAEDLKYIQRINQLRKLYFEVAPGLAEYLAPPAAGSDIRSAMRAFGFRPGPLQKMLTVAGMASILNAVALGCAAGFLGAAARGRPVGLATGIVAFGLCLFLQERLMNRIFLAD